MKSFNEMTALISPPLHTQQKIIELKSELASPSRSSANSLTGDEIFWKRLGVVEDDKHCGLGDIVRDTVESQRNIASLLQRGRLHRVATFGEVSRQDLGHENEFVPCLVWRGILVVDRQHRVDGEVHALTIDGGCGEKNSCSKCTTGTKQS